jgi:hypothetical protein
LTATQFDALAELGSLRDKMSIVARVARLMREAGDL